MRGAPVLQTVALALIDHVNKRQACLVETRGPWCSFRDWDALALRPRLFPAPFTPDVHSPVAVLAFVTLLGLSLFAWSVFTLSSLRRHALGSPWGLALLRR
jgi:hypothetical protein